MDDEAFAKRYELGELLGQGASALVYRARDTQANREVAIKRFTVGDKVQEYIRDWEHEVALLRRLDHPNIVKYLNSCNTAKELCVVLELVGRGSLLAAVREQGCFPEEEVRRCVAQLLHGLLYLHKCGVVHRDIKAANLLRDSDGTVKLTDFGLAAPSSTAAAAVDLVGSVYWMAPETITKDDAAAHFVEGSDIWSVGCVTVELLTGAPPFHDRRPHNALYFIAAEGVVEPPAGVSDTCADFIRRCCERDVAQRPNAAQLLRHPWLRDLLPPDAETDTLVASGAEASPSAVGFDALDVPATSESAPPLHEDEACTSDPASSASPVDLRATVRTAEGDAERGDASLARSNSGNSSTAFPMSRGGSSVTAASASITSGAHRGQRAAVDPAGPRHVTSLEEAGSYIAWVEANLLSDHQEVWLREGGLARAIQALASVKADDAFAILHCISHTAKQSIGVETCFFVALGGCGFWNMDLAIIGTRENIAVLFEACCRAQPPTVAQYAPADCHALDFVLEPEATRAYFMHVLEMLLSGPHSRQGGGSDGQGRSSVAAAAGARRNSRAALRASLNHRTGAAADDGSGGVFLSGVATAPTSAGISAASAAVGGFAAQHPVVPIHFDVDAEWRARAQARFIDDGALNTVHKLLVERIIAGLTTNMDTGWEWANAAFEIIYALSRVRPELFRRLWLLEEGKHAMVCLTEGCRLRMGASIKILAECTRQSPAYVGDTIRGLHFIQVAVDSSTDAALRVEIVRLFPLLMRSSAAAKAVLLELDSSVPLLAHILSLGSSTAPPASATPRRAREVRESVDEILEVFAELSRDEATAAAFARYAKMLTTAVHKMVAARVSGSAADLLCAIELTTRMFERCERPDLFVTSTDLSRVLSQTIQDAGAYGAAVDTAAKTLLDALGAQSKIL